VPPLDELEVEFAVPEAEESELAEAEPVPVLPALAFAVPELATDCAWALPPLALDPEEAAPPLLASAFD
jgi:hypothetical protein